MRYSLLLVLTCRILFQGLLKGIQTERSDDNGVLISEVADSFLNLRQYHRALKFYLMLEDIPNHANVR